jgi:hypothetical protein
LYEIKRTECDDNFCLFDMTFVRFRQHLDALAFETNDSNRDFFPPPPTRGAQIGEFLLTGMVASASACGEERKKVESLWRVAIKVLDDLAKALSRSTGIRGIDGSHTLLAEINTDLGVHPGVVDRARGVGGRDRSMAEGSAWGHCLVLLHDVLGNAHDYGLLVLGILEGARKATALPALVGNRKQFEGP